MTLDVAWESTSNDMGAIVYKDVAVKLTKQGDQVIFGTAVGNWRNWVWSNGGDIVDSSLRSFSCIAPPHPHACTRRPSKETSTHPVGVH